MKKSLSFLLAMIMVLSVFTTLFSSVIILSAIKKAKRLADKHLAM